MECQQSQKSSDSSRRQGGKNRHGVNVTLVKHAQYDIHRDQRRQNQPRLARQGGLEGLGGSLKGCTNIGGNSQLQDRRFDVLHCITQGYALPEIKRYRYCRKLPLVVHGEGCGLHLKMSEGAERDLWPV